MVGLDDLSSLFNPKYSIIHSLASLHAGSSDGLTALNNAPLYIRCTGHNEYCTDIQLQVN